METWKASRPATVPFPRRGGRNPCFRDDFGYRSADGEEIAAAIEIDMRCDKCGDENDVVRLNRLGSFTVCARLGCGHQWHVMVSDLNRPDLIVHDCDCPDYDLRVGLSL
jgi:hypothetical protein